MRGVSEYSTRGLGFPVVAGVVQAVSRRDLRILAYHGVPELGPFVQQMDYLARHYHPVSGGEVVSALAEQRPLPDYSVWVTFDDGRPDVVEWALPTLRRRHIPATLFVVAAVVDTSEPFWWEIVEQALATGAVTEPRILARLKSAPDDERRAEVAELTQHLAARHTLPQVRQLTTGHIRRWVDAGMDVGNHSWDHPCLSNCSPQVQADQLRRADEALANLSGRAVRQFSYPNGNFSTTVDEELRRLGYGVGLLSDHRAAKLSQNPLALSRLRIDSQATLPRFRAIISGGHSAAFATQRRLCLLSRH